MSNQYGWFRPGKASVLIGGQFGSEGKGQAAAWLANDCRTPLHIATTNAGAQAGHTTRYRDGRKYVFNHLPTAGVMRYLGGENLSCYLNAGAIIDPARLHDEIAEYNLFKMNLLIHPRAAVITNEDRERERAFDSSTTKLASTRKGVGAATAGKVMRASRLASYMLADDYVIGAMDLNNQLAGGASVTVEVPQGVGLSINHGLSFPNCTSRDCWVGSGLSDAGIHPSFLGPVCMVVRTNPIRVGNLQDEAGQIIGTSGPFYPDSRELTWNELGVPPEITTVTKRVRRVATWSWEQYRAGLALNRPDIIFLTFCDYLSTSDQFRALVSNMKEEHGRLGLNPYMVFSFGPCVEDATAEVLKAIDWYDHRRF